MAAPHEVEELEELAEESLEQYAVAALTAELRKVADKVIRSVEELREVFRVFGAEFLRERVKPIPKHGRLLPGAAVDSTFPPEGGIELVGGLLVGVVAGYVLFGGSAASKAVSPKALFGRPLLLASEEARQYVPYFAKLLEKKVVLKLLDYHERGLVNLKLIILDGELIPYKLLFSSPRVLQRRRLLRALDEVTEAVLRRSKSLGITLVGVVKRSYSKMFSALVGRRLSLGDKAVASLTLKPGEYLVLGKYLELLPRYGELVGSSELRRVVEERLKQRPEYAGLTVCFYKPTRVPAHAQAVKIEVLDYGGIGFDGVVAALDKLTNPATGLPYPIDLIDKLTRLESRTLELLRRRMVRELSSYLGPLASTLLSHANPEKRYLHEPRPLRAESPSLRRF